jgi:hypothetical protein
MALRCLRCEKTIVDEVDWVVMEPGGFVIYLNEETRGTVPPFIYLNEGMREPFFLEECGGFKTMRRKESGGS